MALSTTSSAREAVAALRTRVGSDRFWTNKLESLQDCRSNPHGIRVHLAVFIEPYLGFVLDGTKTVESRFSINRCAPFERVEKGDIVLLKKSGGGIIGACQITSITYYNLDQSAWTVIKDRFAAALAIKDPAFWTMKARACYASLFGIGHVVTFDPLPVEKRDRRGWVTLAETVQCLPALI